MRTFWRILQLATLAVVFIIISATTLFLIRQWDGGLLERWRGAPFTGSVGDESLAIELATLPVLVGVFVCWGVVRLFRLRAVHNEIDDTFKSVLTVIAGYGRFLLIVVAGLYLLLGHGWAAVAHLVVAVVMFAIFYRHHRARERAIEEQMMLEQEGEDDKN